MTLMTGIKTVYDHIHRNNIKTILLVLLFPIIFIGLVFFMGLMVVVLFLHSGYKLLIIYII